MLFKGIKKHFSELLVAMAASLGYMTIGLIRGWSSPGLPSMMESDLDLIPTEEIISWVSAVPPLGAMCGSLSVAPAMQRLGRKRSLQLAAPLFCAGWLLIAFAESTAVLVAGRIACGFCAGLVTPSAQVYVSESAHARTRGTLGSLPALFMAGGVLVAYVLGTWLSWRRLAMAAAAFPAMMFVALLPLPESPAWLLSHGRADEAKAALRWLRRDADAAAIELGVVQGADEEDTTVTKKAARSFVRRPVLYPFALCLALLGFQQVSGIDTVIFYTVEIFMATGGSVNEYLATIIIGLVQLVCTLLSVLLIDKTGRRPLLLVSGATTALAMALVGGYFHLYERGRAEGLGLVPVASLVLFMVGFSVGYANIPFLLMGELLPAGQRSVLSSLAGSFNLGTMFLVIKTYPALRHAMGTDGTFWLYAALCLASCLFVAVLLPETKGKTLDEIEHHFEGEHQRAKEKKRAKQADDSEEVVTKV